MAKVVSSKAQRISGFCLQRLQGFPHIRVSTSSSFENESPQHYQRVPSEREKENGWLSSTIHLCSSGALLVGRNYLAAADVQLRRSGLINWTPLSERKIHHRINPLLSEKEKALDRSFYKRIDRMVFSRWPSQSTIRSAKRQPLTLTAERLNAMALRSELKTVRTSCQLAAVPSDTKCISNAIQYTATCNSYQRSYA